MRDEEFRRGVVRPIECIKEGFEIIRSDYWLLFAIWLVGGIIGSVTLLIAAGAMTCGTVYCYLKKIDGEPVSFDDLWKGLQWFLPGLIVMLVIVVPMVVIYLVLYLPIIMSAVMGSRMSETELLSMLLAALVIDLVLIVIMVCAHTLLIFTFPLIVDRGMGAVRAMTTSARAVWANLGGVAGLYGVMFLMMLAGQLALCVGTYFVIPIIIAGNVVAYRKVFPREGGRMLPSPPPASFAAVTN
jgi:hypothetical protein